MGHEARVQAKGHSRIATDDHAEANGGNPPTPAHTRTHTHATLQAAWHREIEGDREREKERET